MSCGIKDLGSENDHRPLCPTQTADRDGELKLFSVCF